MKLTQAAYATAFVIAAYSTVINALDIERGLLTVGLATAMADRLPFFTIWTNWLVMATFLWMLATGRMGRVWWMGGLTLWIVITGTVYQLLLREEGLTGVRFIVSLSHHGIIPALVLAWWLAFAPKWPMPWANAVTWLVWPALYATIIVVRGQLTDHWTYYFINVAELGWPAFWISVAKLAAAFFAAGLVTVATARAIAGVSGENRR